MKWSFNGFREWPAGEGQLGLLEGFDVFAASDVAALGREFCEQCVCWRVFGTCDGAGGGLGGGRADEAGRRI